MSGYFGEGEPGGEAVRVLRAAALPRFEVLDGIDIRPLLGERLNINLVTLAPGAVAPVHAHPEEQLGYVATGRCELTDGERTWELGPGDLYRCPPNSPHGARGGPDGCTIVDAFAPPRADLRELLEGGSAKGRS
jgi:quercetin dioxygenase-like cupin family protein